MLKLWKTQPFKISTQKSLNKICRKTKQSLHWGLKLKKQEKKLNLIQSLQNLHEVLTKD